MSITTFYAVKGGAGCTVTAAAFAVQRAQEGARVLLVDDAPTKEARIVLGLPHTDAVSTITYGDDGVLDVADALLPDCVDGYDEVVIDAGLTPVFEGYADRDVLVLRGPDYLGLRRALGSSTAPDRVVVVGEPGRCLDSLAVTDVLGVMASQVAYVPVDPAIAACVDAGLLAHRLPRPLQRLDLAV